MVEEIKTMDERKNKLINLGKKQGYITYEQLADELKGLDIEYFKTQAVQFHDSIIDTPGEFLQHRRYYNALTVTAAEAEIIGLLIAGNSTMQTFPQGFSSLFTKM